MENCIFLCFIHLTFLRQCDKMNIIYLLLLLIYIIFCNNLLWCLLFIINIYTLKKYVMLWICGNLKSPAPEIALWIKKKIWTNLGLILCTLREHFSEYCRVRAVHNCKIYKFILCIIVYHFCSRGFIEMVSVYVVFVHNWYITVYCFVSPGEIIYRFFYSTFLGVFL